MKHTVKIRVLGESWRVPRGFGKKYLRTAEAAQAEQPGKVIDTIVNLLALVGYYVTIDQVASWDLRRRVEAVVYARTEHARASDNPIQRHPKLAWLPDQPWQGPWRGEGAFAGPSGTPISTETP